MPGPATGSVLESDILFQTLSFNRGPLHCQPRQTQPTLAAKTGLRK